MELTEYVPLHCHHAEYPASVPRTQQVLDKYQHCLHFAAAVDPMSTLSYHTEGGKSGEVSE